MRSEKVPTSREARQPIHGMYISEDAVENIGGKTSFIRRALRMTQAHRYRRFVFPQNWVPSVEMFQISAIVLTRTVPSTTVSLPASSLTTLLTLTKSSDLNVVTTLDYSYQSSQTS